MLLNIFPGMYHVPCTKGMYGAECTSTTIEDTNIHRFNETCAQGSCDQLK